MKHVIDPKVLGLTSISEDGVVFETGRPVDFDYVRGTTPSPNFGSRFQQDIEPAGRYMVHVDRRHWGDPLPGQERGSQHFERPLVLAFTHDPDTLYGPTSWKARLREAFEAKGKLLSRKIAAAGYDGIVTVWLVRGSGSHTKEIVDLTMFAHKQNPIDPIRDESFEWVHPAVRAEIDGAVDRALASGATPPLSYAGAGQYGIVICDAAGKAYKVARGEKGRWPQRPTAKSLREEEAWFRFAATLPSIRNNVAKVYGYDGENDVLIRECVQAVENRRPDYTGKRHERLRELYARLQDVMREYGFRRPEFKEDSFVYHPKRGPVLVDAGFASRDIGWANARRAQELLAGAEPRTQWEASSVVHGLRMDAGDELPAAVANRLADRLEATYMQNPTSPRGKPVKPPSYLYHVTFYNRLETIANRGLVPVEPMNPGASSLGRGGYAGSSAGKVFLTEKDGVGFWYAKAEDAAYDMSDDPLTEGFTPVVLRTPTPKGKRTDKAGSRDSAQQAWFVKAKIPSRLIEVWDGSEWLPISEWAQVDQSLAFDLEGFPMERDWFDFRRWGNPLEQIDPELEGPRKSILTGWRCGPSSV